MGGNVGPAAGSGNAAVSGSQAVLESVPVTSAFPRLSHRQWALAAQALLQLDAAPDVSNFSKDAPAATGFDNTGGQLEVSQPLFQDYQRASETLAASVASDMAKLTKLLPKDFPSDATARPKAFVASLGERAFRRPLTAGEEPLFVSLYEQGASLFPGRDALSAGAELTLQALLQSPAFVYRPEIANKPDASGVATLNDSEIAVRLAFFLWDAPPDAPLLAAGKANELHTPEQIAGQVTRMLADRRADEKLIEFHRQLLELRRWDTLAPAGMPPGIGVTLRNETEKFLRASMIDGPGTFAELLTANYSFVNRDTASLYGLTSTFGADLMRTELEAEERAGILTQPGFLMSHAGDTAPILRGVFVNLKLLCAELPPPPVFTPPKMSGTTRRERIDSITGLGTCGEGCHAKVINPAGYPLEYFDNLGRYRTQDNGKPVDGKSTYAFADGEQEINGPVEWAQAIASSQQAHACYVRHWLEFGLGRAYAKEDAALVARIAGVSHNDDKSVRELLSLIAQSQSFKTRKSEAP
ncbi:MAG TPA: DUF1592 domain-containing protein [Polyangiales bacterium]|nr:DUF1592 domain-containing protein [Polyangiales bacterium]